MELDCAGRNINILIADDTTLIRQLLAAQLGQVEGLTVVGEASDGRAAVELTSQLMPDVVVMDLDMPHLNGLQAVERIKAQNPQVRVVMLTAHSGLAPIGQFMGVNECLDDVVDPLLRESRWEGVEHPLHRITAHSPRQPGRLLA